jgi:carbon monoxide dehydrogenase subunit G
MKFSGESNLAATPTEVWEAIHDPAVLARTLPGCETLEEIGEHHYRMTVNAGVSAVRGQYDGEVALTQHRQPESFVLKARGAGAPGTVDADVFVRLTEASGGGTVLTYEADAVVGGAIGGVGQRMLSGVSRKMATQFFTAIDEHLAAGPTLPEEPVPATGAPEGVAMERRAAYAGRGVTPTSGPGFALGVVAGGLIALAGVAVGAVIGRRRQ